MQKSDENEIYLIKKLYNQKEAALYLGVSVDTFRKFDIDQTILEDRIIRYDVDDLKTFIYDRKVTNCASSFSGNKEKQKWKYTKEKVVRTTTSHGMRGANDNDALQELRALKRQN